MKDRRIIIAVLLCIFLPSLLLAQSRKERRYKRHYMNVNQKLLNGRKYQPILKWDQDVVYAIEGNTDVYWHKRIVKLMDEMQEYFPHRLVYTKDASEANMIVFLGGMNVYKMKYLDRGVQIPDNTNNWFAWRNNNRQELTFTSFCVDVNQINFRDFESYLIQRFLLKSMGLMGSSDSKESVFYSDWTPQNSTWSKQDLIALKIQYSAPILPGMSRKEVEMVLPDIALGF